MVAGRSTETQGLLLVWFFVGLCVTALDFHAGNRYLPIVAIGTALIILVLYAFAVRMVDHPVLLTMGILVGTETLFVVAYAWAYQLVGIMRDGKITTDFVDCIYFSAITWTTVGYGDIVPTSEARLWAASEALLSYFTIAILIGTVASLIRVRKQSGDKLP